MVGALLLAIHNFNNIKSRILLEGGIWTSSPSVSR
jgi:hypothetical protein